MRRLILTFATLAMTALCATAQEQVTKYTEGLRFCESTLPYNDLLLVANFGTEELDPLNTKGRGYIAAIDAKGKTSTFIACDGNLSAPKGMAIYKDHLFISDVNKVVVYDLTDKTAEPQTVELPEGELFVNDIITIEDRVLIAVTNTGHIFDLHASDINNLAAAKLMLFATLPGANGITIHGDKIYAASYNPNGTPANENVIYVGDATGGEADFQPLIKGLAAGQYDGIAVSGDGKYLYFTSWTSNDGTGAVYRYVLGDASGKVDRLSVGSPMVGPADISADKLGQLWIPDLANSCVYRLVFK